MHNKEDKKCLHEPITWHRKNICACSERLEFKMEKENFFDDENKSEDEEEIMLACSCYW